MATTTERMKAMRLHRRAEDIAAQVARLPPASERDTMDWIEAVSEFDADTPQ